MNTAVAPQNTMPTAVAVDDLIARGDLTKLTPEQRVTHYNNVCRSIGLNPLTQPFQYVTLNNKVQLYARKDATDQLRKIHGISLTVVNRTVQGELLTVHVRATDKTGRSDEDFGVVSLAGLRGEAAANATMKAVTKGKRRATLSLVGLGMLDETELEHIPNAFVHEDASAVPSPPTAKGDRFYREPQNAETAESPPKDEPAPVEDIEPYELEHTENSEDEWKRWGNDLFAYIKAAKTFDRIDEWIVANGDGFEALKHYDVGKFNRLRHMIQAVQDAKAKAAQDESR